MLLIFEDGDEDAFLKVQGLAQSASRIELMEFRSQQSTSALEIRENQRRVFCKGREIPLTKTEYEILLYLFQNINQVLTHDQIYEKIWKEPDYGEARKLVSHHVQSIRRKLNKWCFGSLSAVDFFAVIWHIESVSSIQLERCRPF